MTPEATPPVPARCSAHPDHEAIQPCVRCGRFACAPCLTSAGYCNDCVERGFTGAPPLPTGLRAILGKTTRAPTPPLVKIAAVLLAVFTALSAFDRLSKLIAAADYETAAWALATLATVAAQALMLVAFHNLKRWAFLLLALLTTARLSWLFLSVFFQGRSISLGTIAANAVALLLLLPGIAAWHAMTWR